MNALKALTADGLFIGQSSEFLRRHAKSGEGSRCGAPRVLIRMLAPISV
jgi:hypothetical protein